MTTEVKEASKFLGNLISGTPSCKIYDTGAAEYEDYMDQVKYHGPIQLMEQLDKLNVPKDGKILDVCAGTGAIGRELVKRGYTDVHAIDGSEGMLAKAKAEGNYKSYTYLLFEPDSKLPYEDHSFDCVLMAGVFAPGHLPIVAMREVCRVTKVGGKVAFILCDPEYYADKDEQFADRGFYKIVDKLCDDGSWKVHEGFPVSVPYIEYSDGFIMAFEVTGPVVKS